MLKDKLVQNYYEVHGSFDGISVSEIGGLVEDSGSLIDECYRILGYSGNGISPKMVHDLRLAYRRNDLETLHVLCGAVSLSEAARYFEEHGIEVPQHEEQDAAIKNGKYVAMLAEYLKMKNGIVVKFNGSLYNLDELLGGLRYTLKKIREYAKTIVTDPENKIIEFQQGDKDEISNGIFTVKAKLTAAAQREIVIKAIIKASGALDTTLPAAVVKKPELIPLLAFNDNKAYLEALETAEVRGITYKDLMAEKGYNVYDCLAVYQYARCIPVTILDAVYLMTEKSTLKEPYSAVIDAEDLPMTLQAFAMGGAACNT